MRVLQAGVPWPSSVPFCATSTWRCVLVISQCYECKSLGKCNSLDIVNVLPTELLLNIFSYCMVSWAMAMFLSYPMLQAGRPFPASVYRRRM